jgi:hypothetical protein
MTTTLKQKLYQAEMAYKDGVQRFQELQHDLIQREGAIRALRELIEEQEQSDEQASSAE